MGTNIKIISTGICCEKSNNNIKKFRVRVVWYSNNYYFLMHDLWYILIVSCFKSRNTFNATLCNSQENTAV